MAEHLTTKYWTKINEIYNGTWHDVFNLLKQFPYEQVGFAEGERPSVVYMTEDMYGEPCAAQGEVTNVYATISEWDDPTKEENYNINVEIDGREIWVDWYYLTSTSQIILLGDIHTKLETINK